MIRVSCTVCQLGVKVSKAPLLKKLIQTESKHRAKITQRLSLGAGVAECADWLKSIEKLRSYAPRFEEQGTTGAQLLQISSTEELGKLGVDSEVDCNYMLLQFARVRDHKNSSSVRTDDYTEHEILHEFGDVRPRFIWAIKFDSGEMHRYTTEQIQDKFGVDEVQAGMELNHKTRGHAMIVSGFIEQRLSIETNEVSVSSASICPYFIVSQIRIEILRAQVPEALLKRAQRTSTGIEMQPVLKGETVTLNQAEDDLGVVQSLRGSKRGAC